MKNKIILINQITNKVVRLVSRVIFTKGKACSVQGLESESLQNTGGSKVGQQLDDVIGSGGWCWQMVSGWLEAILISDPLNVDYLAIGRGVAVATTGDGSGVFGQFTDLLLGSALIDNDTVSSFEAVILELNSIMFLSTR